MMRKYSLSEIEKHYRIDDDGAIWSLRLGRYLKPTLGGGYIPNATVFLRDVGLAQVSVHILVALKYIGDRPDGAIIRHKDGNSLNNRAENLEYIDRGENTKMSQRKEWEERNDAVPLSWNTKRLLDNPRKKAVASSTGEVWGSVNECAAALGVTRTGVYMAIKHNRKMHGGTRLFYPDEIKNK